MDEPNLQWDNIFMSFLEILAKKSTCLKYKTSAILVKNSSEIVGMGYNEPICSIGGCDKYWYECWKKSYQSIKFIDWINSDEWRKMHSKWSKINEIHAEANALNCISKRDMENNHYTLYTLYSPCDDCTKLIISYGKCTVKYKYLYKNNTQSLERLKENGIHVEQIS